MKTSWEIEFIKPEQKWEIERTKPEQKWEITLKDKVVYTLPIASPEELGGVKPDSKTPDMDIPVAVDEEGKLWTKDNIDETLSIKGFSADAAAVGEALKNIKVDGFVSYTEQSLTDEQKAQARINIGAGVNFVQPFVPYYYQEVESGGYLLALMYINIEDMKDGVFYAPPANTNVYKYYLYFNIVCDDGTEKNVAIYVRFPAGAVFYKTSDGNYITLFEENMLYFIDCSDKSTADKVTFGISKNIKYIGTNNSTKFTPKSDYHPATKKYVDDSVSVKADKITLDAVSALVGDTSISEQITTALNESSDFIINIDSNRMADKTWQEVFEAREAGRRLYCVYNDRLYHYSLEGYDYYRFICSDTDTIYSINFYDWTQEVTVLESQLVTENNIATDEEIIDMLAELDILPTVTDSDGAILADENKNILLW